MLFNVCLFCGKAGCRCPAGPGDKRWRAPVVSVQNAIKAQASKDALIVFGASENFDTIWGGDADWDLSLEAF